METRTVETLERELAEARRTIEELRAGLKMVGWAARSALDVLVEDLAGLDAKAAR